MEVDTGLLKKMNQVGDNASLLFSLFTMQIIWCSDAFTEGLGYEKKELEETLIRDIMTISPEMLTKEITKFLGKKGKDVKVLKTKEGKSRRATGVVHPFTYDKEPYIAVYDLTFTDK